LLQTDFKTIAAFPFWRLHPWQSLLEKLTGSSVFRKSPTVPIAIPDSGETHGWKTIAIYAVGSFKLAELAPLIREALDVGDPFMSQTAQWSWSQLNP